VTVDPTRKQMPGNREQPIHSLFNYIYIADKHEGLILSNAMTTLNGNPVDNFLKKDVCFNPEGILNGACHVQIIGHYAYVSCEAGLVVVDINEPTQPKVTSVVDGKYLKHPKMVAAQFRYAYVCDDEGVKVLDITDLSKPVPKASMRIPEAHSIYLSRTYAYVAAGSRGLVILDIQNAEEPKVDQVFNANGNICDARSVQLGVTYNSLFAYIADGKNGMRIVQLMSPETPGYEGFSTRPTPRLIATYRPPHGKILNVARGLDRDRAVDENGNQIGVFGRVGARPLNEKEQHGLFLKNGKLYFVTDDPKDATIYNYNPPRKRRRRGPMSSSQRGVG
jgi:hypothetical protein